MFCIQGSCRKWRCKTDRTVPTGPKFLLTRRAETKTPNVASDCSARFALVRTERAASRPQGFGQADFRCESRCTVHRLAALALPHCSGAGAGLAVFASEALRILRTARAGLALLRRDVSHLADALSLSQRAICAPGSRRFFRCLDRIYIEERYAPEADLCVFVAGSTVGGEACRWP